LTVVPGLVSTIIPVRNRPRMVLEAVDSVLAQTYRPIEVIVCDDGSTDETAAAVEGLMGRHPDEVRLLRLPSQGPGPAREAGRLAARGEYIQYLDSDDLLRPRKFAVQVTALQGRPDCGAAYGYIALWREGAPPSDHPHKWSGHALPTLFPWLLVDRWWNTDTPLFRRSLCDAVGPWTDLRWSQDWEYDGRVGALGTRLVHCPEFVCDQRHHSESRQTSSGDWKAPDRLRERHRFLGLMLKHGLAAGVTPAVPEMQHFSRWLFYSARECAAAGMLEEAAASLAWAKQAAGPDRAGRVDYRLWDLLVRTIGGARAGRLARGWSRWRGGGVSPASLAQSWMPGAQPRPPA
jgi:glycosyltransferase involved in cell wall biosynthesis